MSNLVIELPPKAEQDAFNRVRWEELSRDPELAKIENRLEMDRHGRVVMFRMPTVCHSVIQTEIAMLLMSLLKEGRVRVVCPVSTSDGVKAIDASWISKKRDEGNDGELFCIACPEICVEVLSRQNSPKEMAERRSLYFEAGAMEVWFCSPEGLMQFFSDAGGNELDQSAVCPEFPKAVKLS